MRGTSASLTDRVRERLAADSSAPTPAAVAAAVRVEGGVLGDVAVHRLVGELRAELVGFGPLQPFVDDPTVTDVLVNGPRSVWVDRGAGLERTDAVFRDAHEVRCLASRLATTAGRRLDDANPCVDAGLEGGVRLHAVLPPVCADGPLISLRIPRARTFSLDELQACGGLGAGAIEWVHAVIGSRASFLLTGGTGTGKTTMLSAFLGLVAPDHRLVIVEDSAELRPDHPHAVHLEARTSNVEGAGAITMRDLVRHALRMRPDRLVVGEARGAEVADLMAAMNTGHEGGCGTLHANSPADVPSRIAALASMAGLSRESAMLQLGSALDVVMHVTRDASGRRRLEQIASVERHGSDVQVVPALTWDHAGSCTAGPGLDSLRRRLAQT